MGHKKALNIIVVKKNWYANFMIVFNMISYKTKKANAFTFVLGFHWY